MPPTVCPSMSSHLGFDWGNVQTGLNNIANIWNAYNPQGHTVTPSPIPQPVLGGSTGTLLVVGGVALLAYALMSKKR